MADAPHHNLPTESIGPGNASGGSPPGEPPSGGMGHMPGDWVGPYRLLEIIGEGGFGVVYLAERREPMVQRVALKVIKPGMDSKSVIARFEQERQALAVMDHPNVAKVLDGGVTSGGRPYFVMEYVKGEPITAYSDRQRLTIKQRLALFASVCDAVQHAHMKGIIHRDLKPSNILIAPAEEGHTPIVKVIDFGVAKAISHTLTEKTIFTERGQLIGTPEYMSPEQAEMGATDIDTRTDVYALGVLLYEMLSGTLPFDPTTLRAAGFAEIQRIIREEEAPRPSTRLSTADDETGATIAKARQADREKIASELRRELELIPLKALRKDRTRRYASAEALGEDVRRYLEGQPLEAAPESRGYLLKKFVSRNRGQVAAAGAVFAALVLGLAGTAWQAQQASREAARADERAVAAEAAEQAAEAARDAEKERADQLKKVSDFQAQMLAQIDTTKAGLDLMADVRDRFEAALEPAGVPEAERTARVDALRQELVRVNATDAAAAMIDRTILRPAIRTIDERFKDDPATDASLRQALANLYHTMGLYEAAFPLQESALATRRRVLGEEHPDTLISINNMGFLLQSQGELDQAEPYLREALEQRRRVLGEEHTDTLTSINNMGSLLWAQGKLDQAKPYLRESLEKLRRVLGEEHPHTLSSIGNMGLLLQAQGKLDQAQPYYREALEKSRRVLGEEHPSTLISISNMGLLLNAQGKLEQSEPYYREALEKSRRVLGEEHPDTLISINNLGALLKAQGKLAEAEPYFRESLEKHRRVLGEEHPSTLNSINNMGSLLQDQGKLAEAEPHLREALEKLRRVLGEENPDTLSSINNMGLLLGAQGKLDQAEPYYREALEIRRRVLGKEHPSTLTSISNMGSLLWTQGKLDQAEPYYREALEIRRRVLGEEHPHTLISIGNMGLLLQAQGELDQAEPYYRESLEKHRRVLGEEHPHTLISIHSMGGLLKAQGKLDQAEPYYRESLEKHRRVLGEEHPGTLISIGSMGGLLREQGKHREAIDLLTPAEPAARRAFNGGNAHRLAGLLIHLGRARVGLGYEAERFTLAEANLLEAHAIFVQARGPTHPGTLGCVRGLVDLHTAWHAHEPDEGYDAKADQWRAKLPPATEAEPPKRTP
ncbi:MAG: serine/threonine-protein kinase [Planctomycetota bacterium]